MCFTAADSQQAIKINQTTYIMVSSLKHSNTTPRFSMMSEENV